MPSLVVPFRGEKGKSRLGPLPREARSVLALAMLARRRRGLHRGRADVRRRADRRPTLGEAALVPDPGGGQGARRPRRPRGRGARRRRRRPAPRRQRRPAVRHRPRSARARGRGPGRRTRATPRPPTGRRTRSRSPRPASSSRSTGRAAPPGSRRSRRRGAVDAPNLVDDVDDARRSRTADRTARAVDARRARLAPHRGARVRATRPLGRRRRRALPPRPRRRARRRTRSRSSATSATTSRVLGLHVSPDLDSVLYALAGVADEERGWGRAEESWNALAAVAELGGESWFRLGDRDIGLHLVRTELLRAGRPLSAVTAQPRRGVRAPLLAAAGDRRSAAHVHRDAGRDLLVPGVVRRPRPPGRGGRGPLHGRARGPSGARACSRRSRRPT